MLGTHKIFKMVAAVGKDLIPSNAGIVYNHEGFYGLAEDWIRHANDGSFNDAGQAI